jgi:hypothetical protein
MPKIPPFNLMLDLSQHTVSSGYSNTPLIQALLVDGPQFKTHTAWLVTRTLDILLNPFTNATAGLPTEEQLHDIKL